MKLFDLGTRILVNPTNSLHLGQIEDILKINFKGENDKLESLLQVDTNSTAVDLKLHLQYWNHLRKQPKSLGWVIEQLKSVAKNESFLENELEATQLLFDLTQLEKLWNSFVRNESHDNQTLTNFRYFLALNKSEENKDEITLASVHTTKGLEFGIVFLIGMNDGVFPDYRARTEAALQEERNNLYVAITRAKRALYITYPLKRLMPWGAEKPQSITRFLKSIEL